MARTPRPTGALIGVVAGSLIFLGTSSPASAVDYPSWDEVQNAQQNQASTQRQIDQIAGLLVSLEQKMAELGRAAQVKGESYLAAREALEAASARADRLEAQADAAAERATESARRAGQVTAQLARTRGGSFSAGLLFSADPDGFLNSLGAMTKLTEQSAEIYQQATTDRNVAQSLTDQAEAAEESRVTRAAEEEAALADANAAADAVRSQLAGQRDAAEQLYAQLASLKGTTADVERRYIEGLTDAAPGSPAASNPSPSSPAPSNPSPSNPSPSNPSPSNPTPPKPVPANPAPAQPAPVPANPAPAPVEPAPAPSAPQPSAVDAAIAYAKAQLGDRYEYAGSGPDAWDCSGLTKAAYASAGVYIGAHGATSQYNYLSDRLVPVGQMVPGDLLFYSTGGTKYHTTIYIGGGQMIEAPYEGVPVRITGVRYYDLVPYAARPTG